MLIISLLISIRGFHMLSLNIIGCGKLGKTIGKLIVQNNAARVVGIVNSTLQSGIVSANFVGQGIACENIHALPKAEIYLIATKDDLISDIANRLHAEPMKAGTIIFHCSGTLSSEILIKLKEKNCLIASIHPIKSFANPEQAISTFTGTYCAIEGDHEALHTITNLFQKIGGKVFSIDKNNKSIYHVGGVIANNYLVTLHYQAVQCYVKAGFDTSTAKQIVSKLMSEAMNNVNNASHSKALTGPIQRGDVKTVFQHITTLKKDSSLSTMKDIYSSMGKGTLAFSAHTPIIQNQLLDVLNDKSIDSINLKAKL